MSETTEEAQKLEPGKASAEPSCSAIYGNGPEIHRDTYWFKNEANYVYYRECSLTIELDGTFTRAELEHFLSLMPNAKLSGGSDNKLRYD